MIEIIIIMIMLTMFAGALFPNQSSDYQDKAIQLCVQALSQFTKTELKSSSSLLSSSSSSTTTTMNMFSSDEEKKKKDRKCFITQCSVLGLISSIVRSFPSNAIEICDVTVWMRSIIDLLFTMLGKWTLCFILSS